MRRVIEKGGYRLGVEALGSRPLVDDLELVESEVTGRSVSGGEDAGIQLFASRFGRFARVVYEPGAAPAWYQVLDGVESK